MRIKRGIDPESFSNRIVVSDDMGLALLAFNYPMMHPDDPRSVKDRLEEILEPYELTHRDECNYLKSNLHDL